MTHSQQAPALATQVGMELPKPLHDGLRSMVSVSQRSRQMKRGRNYRPLMTFGAGFVSGYGTGALCVIRNGRL